MFLKPRVADGCIAASGGLTKTFWRNERKRNLLTDQTASTDVVAGPGYCIYFLVATFESCSPLLKGLLEDSATC